MTHHASHTLLPMLLAAMLLAACGGRVPEAQHIDDLNATAHSWRYRNVDSLAHYAAMALAQCPEAYPEGRAEALNHLAYERAQRLDFDSALALTHAVLAIDGAATEHAVADIMAMKVAQRTSDNVAFFTHRTHAGRILDGLGGSSPSAHAAARLNFARGEMHIVASTYFYYVEQLERARTEIAAAEPFCQMQLDTAQWLNYSYMRGSGDLVEGADAAQVTRDEFDYLFKCFTFAKNQGYVYFEANALQALASLLADTARVATLQRHKPEALIYLDIIFPQPTSTAMADEAVELFRRYGDDFQTSNALRTRGTLAAAGGRYAEALQCYRDALDLVGGTRLAEWEAGIWEKMSVALAGIGDLDASAAARNNYLDLRYHTREDAEWTSRAETLREENARLRQRIGATVGLALVLALVVVLLRRWWERRSAERLERAAADHQRLLAEAEARTHALTEAEEQLEEERQATVLRIQRYKRQNMVQRAKLNLAREIIPLLDRIIHAARRMQRQGRPSDDALDYICELTQRIDENGQLLTDWIQMERGRVSLNITTFDLEPLLDTLRRSAFAFRQKGITLDVAPTSLSVKADRALTLFMLNTLADNARKHTPEGGRVSITATEGAMADGPYVELAVSDTGTGLSPEQQEAIVGGRAEMRDGHGFGLMNCRGIVERYRKTSRHFAVAAMGVESRVGQGSRFWFRLPRPVAVVVAAWAMVTAAVAADPYALADSLYYANVEGRHVDAMRFAASAMEAVTAWHGQLNPSAASDLPAADAAGRMTLLPTDGEAADVAWLLRGDTLDYSLLIGIRNEAAVAALAMRQWDVYAYNNHVYTRLYKLYNKNTTLEADCLRLEQAQRGQRIALWCMLAVIIVAMVLAYAFWLRPRMLLRRQVEAMRRQRYDSDLADERQRQQRQLSDVELAEDETRRRLYEENRLHVQNQIMDNCLSTIKHETLYYPSRIRHLAQLTRQSAHDDASTLDTLVETATYCREVYATFIAQGEQQAAQMPMRIADVESHGCRVRADAEMLDMLLSTLMHFEKAMATPDNAAADVACRLDVAPTPDGRYIRFALTNTAATLTEAQCLELFAPHSGGFDMLVAKQVIRETDAMLGHVGCRIQAEPTPDGHGHTIWFTLPQAPTPNTTHQQPCNPSK